MKTHELKLHNVDTIGINIEKLDSSQPFSFHLSSTGDDITMSLRTSDNRLLGFSPSRDEIRHIVSFLEAWLMLHPQKIYVEKISY